jgi:hypothetical protein
MKSQTFLSPRARISRLARDYTEKNLEFTESPKIISLTSGGPRTYERDQKYTGKMRAPGEWQGEERKYQEKEHEPGEARIDEIR